MAEPGVPQLASYVTAEVPGTYWVELVFDGAWRPAEHIPMPHHHATRLELVNAADVPALSTRRSERLRVTIRVDAKEIRQLAGQPAWRATWYARVLSVD